MVMPSQYRGKSMGCGGQGWWIFPGMARMANSTNRLIKTLNHASIHRKLHGCSLVKPRMGMRVCNEPIDTGNAQAVRPPDIWLRGSVDRA
jgi:hypothetical protein